MGAAANRTKERILEGALALFNAEGVSSLSALDIATALSISPGHLYYHFRGKAELAAALMDRLEAELDLVFAAALEALTGPAGSIETLWTHVHIVLEEVQDAIFVFREPGALAALGLDVRVRTILARLERFSDAAVEALAFAGAIRAEAEVRAGLSRALSLGLAFGLVRAAFDADLQPPRARIARTAAEIMLPIASVATPG